VVTNNSINAQSVVEGLAQVERPLIISGPCSAESKEQVVDTAKQLSKRGVHILRAGIWKPRTRPNKFEGKGSVALNWLVSAREATGLPIATEVANAQHVEACLNAGVDVMWIGARTTVSPFAVQEIADALKGTNVPVFVKNPMHADLSLWLGAIERVRNTTDGPVWAIHRGFSQYGQKEYRNAPMWEIAIGLKMALPEVPIICDPSHIAGNRMLLKPVAQKAMDLGMEGLMLETHPNPEEALSDAKQQLTPAAFGQLIDSLTIRNASEPKISSADLAALRLQMDSIDEQVIELLHTRMNLARQIGLHKWENGMTILQMERWKEVFDTREGWALKAGLSSEFILNFLEQLHKESIRVQNKEMTSK
jgi:chorismate mutase